LAPSLRARPERVVVVHHLAGADVQHHRLDAARGTRWRCAPGRLVDRREVRQECLALVRFLDAPAIERVAVLVLSGSHPERAMLDPRGSIVVRLSLRENLRGCEPVVTLAAFPDPWEPAIRLKG
jgi:hypothetical protein